MIKKELKHPKCGSLGKIRSKEMRKRGNTVEDIQYQGK
jgi:hypothetical protein